MGKIKELKQDVIEQIAAGEVVEDPSSIVKELVENSLDAGSNKIFVEIEEGGKNLIRVTDDGSGMTKEDAALSVKKHATSKLGGISDLFNIATLGFRGEALAAISSVSRFELITKTDYAMEGTKVKVEDGEVNIESVACPKGTTIVAKDLFYNTPARKKHLRTRTAEAGKILDIITKYALANPLIYFRLVIDGKQALNSPNTASMLNNIVDVYGNDLAKELIEVDYSDESQSIKGFISKPSFSRSDKDLMNIFINGRYVKNKTILDAVYDSYHTLLHGQRYPFAMLHINLDPKKLDVNIHPNKLKIKIEEEGRLYEKIFDVIRETLKSNDILSSAKDEKKDDSTQRSLDANGDGNVKAKDEVSEAIKEQKSEDRKYPVQEDKQNTMNESLQSSSEVKSEMASGYVEGESRTEKGSGHESTGEAMTKNDSSNETESTLGVGRSKEEVEGSYDGSILSGAKKDSEVVEGVRKDLDDADATREANESGKVQENGADSTEKRRRLKILGQIYKTYILIETEKGLTIMDQHASHERILFDRILKDSMNMNFEKQELISPVELDLGVRETSAIESNKAMLKQFGFELENFGGGTYLLRKVPVVFGKNLTKEFLIDLITDILHHTKINSLDKMKHEVISTMACKAAIKAGDELTSDRMKEIVRDFFALDMSYTCPHGRPIILEITIQELEKRFKRTGF